MKICVFKKSISIDEDHDMLLLQKDLNLLFTPPLGIISFNVKLHPKKANVK
jgi:hypothetical protein